MHEISRLVTSENLKPEDTILPLTQSNVWYRDLYKMIWENDIKGRLVLYLELIQGNDLYPSGITITKINNEDGTIKFGNYNLSMYAYPLKDEKNIENNQKLQYSISFILNEPKPQIVSEKAPEPEIRLPLLEEIEQPTEEDLKEEEIKKPETRHSHENPKDAFIPNTIKQFTEEQFDEKEIIVLYIDSARFLPENVTLSQVTMKGVISSGETVIQPITAR